MTVQRAYSFASKQGPIIDAVVLSGEVVACEPARLGWLGVIVCAVPIEASLVGVAGQRSGLLVERTAKSSPAARAGIRAADVMLVVNRTVVDYDGSLRVALQGRRVGDPVSVTLLRDKRVKILRVVPDLV